MKAIKKKKRRNNLRYYLDNRKQVNRWLIRFREMRKWKRYYEKEKIS